MVLSRHDEWILETRLKPVVTAQLMARAVASSTGPHPRELIEVMDFVRRNPDPDKPRYLIIKTPEGFAIGVRSPVRGGPPQLVESEPHATRDEAEYDVLVRRLHDYGVTW